MLSKKKIFVALFASVSLVFTTTNLALAVKHSRSVATSSEFDPVLLVLFIAVPLAIIGVVAFFFGSDDK